MLRLRRERVSRGGVLIAIRVWDFRACSARIATNDDYRFIARRADNLRPMTAALGAQQRRRTNGSGVVVNHIVIRQSSCVPDMNIATNQKPLSVLGVIS